MHHEPDTAGHPREGHAHPELDVADAPAPETPAAPGDGLDLLSIGLAVFFIALIVTVGAMLLLPRIVSGG